MKIKNLLSAAFITTLFSCSEQPNNTIPLDQAIIGKWEFDYTQKDTKGDCDGNICDYQFYKIKYGRTYYEFSQDHKLHSAIWGQDTSGTFQLKGDTIFEQRGIPAETYGIPLKVETINKDTMHISFMECDTKHVWRFLRIQ